MSHICLALREQPGYSEILSRRWSDHRLTWLHDKTSEERLALLDSCDVLLVDMLTREVKDEEMELLEHIPLTQLLAAGADQMKLSALPRDAFICTNVGGWAPPMAEHAVAMVFALTRKLCQQKVDMAAGLFQRRGYGLRMVEGMHVLIIGYGGIGQRCADKFQALGCSISALGRRRPVDERLASSWTLDELHKALADADIVILSLPANREGTDLINAAALQTMKDDAILISLGRAASVNHDALLAHLQSHPDFSAGIDVWWNEDSQWSGEEPLISLPNVVASAHNSNDYQSAWIAALQSAMDNVDCFLSGEQPQGRVYFDDYLEE